MAATALAPPRHTGTVRGLGSKALVAAVLLLAIVATADALRSRDAAEPQATTVAERAFPASAVAALRANRVAGRLVFAGNDCGVRALALPDLNYATAPPLRCAAFVPHGRLGLRNGEVAWFARGDGHTIVLSHAALLDTLARDEPMFDRDGARVRRVAWMNQRRYAALVENEDGAQLLALLEGREIFWSIPTRDVEWLRASPRGSFVAARFRSGGLLLVDLEAQPLRVPRTITPVRALAWAPDERWAAIATPRHVFIVRSGAHWPLVRLPIVARDVGWRE